MVFPSSSSSSAARTCGTRSPSSFAMRSAYMTEVREYESTRVRKRRPPRRGGGVAAQSTVRACGIAGLDRRRTRPGPGPPFTRGRYSRLQQRPPHLTSAAPLRNIPHATSEGRWSNERQAIPFGSNAELHAPTEVIPGDLHIPDIGDRGVEDELPVIGREAETTVDEAENSRDIARDPAEEPRLGLDVIRRHLVHG